jgi:hypothetical protein
MSSAFYHPPRFLPAPPLFTSPPGFGVLPQPPGFTRFTMARPVYQVPGIRAYSPVPMGGGEAGRTGTLPVERPLPEGVTPPRIPPTTKKAPLHTNNKKRETRDYYAAHYTLLAASTEARTPRVLWHVGGTWHAAAGRVPCTAYCARALCSVLGAGGCCVLPKEAAFLLLLPASASIGRYHPKKAAFLLLLPASASIGRLAFGVWC